MSQIGLGAMLHLLAGGSEKSPELYYGRTITNAEEVGDALHLTFSDGVILAICDNGQSCCERRYMVVDDDLSALVGHKLVSIETNESKYINDDSGEWGDCHEAVFLDVKTNGGMVSFSFHNEHNGYYGGFGLSLNEVMRA